MSVTLAAGGINNLPVSDHCLNLPEAWRLIPDSGFPQSAIHFYFFNYFFAALSADDELIFASGGRETLAASLM